MKRKKRQQQRRWARLGGMVLDYRGRDVWGRKVYDVYHAGNLFKLQSSRKLRAVSQSPFRVRVSLCS